MASMIRGKIDLPLKFLEKSLDLRILVKLKDGSEYVGVLERSDISMNLILSEARQVTESNELIANYGRVLIRGSNVLYISIEPDKIQHASY